MEQLNECCVCTDDRFLAASARYGSYFSQVEVGVSTFELDARYATTRSVTRAHPCASKPGPGVSILPVRSFALDGHACGGLRTHGLFKLSSADKPLVTVITVVFNGVKTLEKTIMSVLEQSYDNVEYLVIDGGSSDGTLELLKKYEFAIDFWSSEKDNGIYGAMNKGLRMAQGKWVALLNADDTYFTRGVLAQLAALHDDVYVAASDVMMHTVEGLKRFAIDETRPLYKNVPYMHTGMFVRSDLYSRLGKFREDLRIASDIDFIMRLMENGIDVYHFPEPFVLMRDGGISTRSFAQGRREYRQVYVEHGGSLFWAYIGYYLSLVEKILYDNNTCRGLFRFVKRTMRR